MYNTLRLFCENLKAIEVKLTEIYTCKSPPYGELCSSKSTEPILLKFCTLFLFINYEVTLSSFFFHFNLFLNNKISDFFDEKSVF